MTTTTNGRLIYEGPGATFEVRRVRLEDADDFVANSWPALGVPAADGFAVYEVQRSGQLSWVRDYDTLEDACRAALNAACPAAEVLP